MKHLPSAYPSIAQHPTLAMIRPAVLLLSVLVVALFPLSADCLHSVYWLNDYGYTVESGQNATLRYFLDMERGSQDTVATELQALRVRVYCPVSQDTYHRDYIFDVPLVAVSLEQPSKTEGSFTIGPLISPDAPTTRCEVKLVQPVVYGPYHFYTKLRSIDKQMVWVNGPNVSQVRLAMLPDTAPGPGVSVTWTSSSNNDTGYVLYYPSLRENQTQVVNASLLPAYIADGMMGEPASIKRGDYFRPRGKAFRALLGPLQTGMEYTYIINGQVKRTFWSPRQRSKSGHAHLIAYGNMGVFHAEEEGPEANRGAVTSGVSSSVENVLHRLATDLGTPQHKADVVIHLGNLAYAGGRGYVWDYFLNNIHSISSRVPYHVVPGEMEIASGSANDSDVFGNQFAEWTMSSNASGGEGGMPLRHHFASPTSRQGPDGGVWYSHTLGNARIVYISTEHDLAPGSVQHTWLERELAAVDRQLHPWLIIAGHRPLYHTSRSDQHIQTALRQYLDPLLYRYGVNIYLSAHHSSYLRSCPMNQRGECVRTDKEHGVVHVSCGTAGAPLDRYDDDNTQQVSWLRKQLFLHGYCDLRTKSARHARLQFRSASGHTEDVTLLGNSWREDVRTTLTRLPEAVHHEPMLESVGDGSGADSLRRAHSWEVVIVFLVTWLCSTWLCM